MPAFDSQLFLLVNSLIGRWEWLDALMISSTRWLVWAVIASAFLPWLFTLGHRDIAARFAAARLALAAVSASLLAFVGNWVFAQFFFRARPYVSLDAVRRLASEPLTAHSFPSSHASAAFAAAFVVLLSRRQWGLALLVLAALVGASRVFVGVHYPLDVVAGVFVGLFWAAIVTKVVRPPRKEVRY